MASSINASTSGPGGVITTADNSGILSIQTAGNTVMTVNGSNVGIGTTSPSYPLDIQGSPGTNVGIALRLQNNSTGGPAQINMGVAGSTAVTLSTEGSGGGPAGGFNIQIGGSNRLSLDTSGNIYAGGTSANAATAPIYSKTTARAWFQFNGTTGTIAGSFNISSITGSGGNWTVNMASALQDANYCAVGGAGISGAGTSIKVTNGSWTSSQFTVDTASGATNNWTAAQFMSVAVFR